MALKTCRTLSKNRLINRFTKIGRSEFLACRKTADNSEHLTLTSVLVIFAVIAITNRRDAYHCPEAIHDL